MRGSTSRGDADGVGAVEQPDFGGLVVARFDEHEGVGLRDAELHEEAGILLLVDHLVRFGASCRGDGG